MEEGPDCKGVIVTVYQSKTNQIGNQDVFGALRHRDVACCAHGWLALYFFARWIGDEEAFPDFTRSASWFNIKVFPGNTPEEAIKAQTHVQIVTR